MVETCNICNARKKLEDWFELDYTAGLCVTPGIVCETKHSHFAIELYDNMRALVYKIAFEVRLSNQICIFNLKFAQRGE